MDDTIRDRVNRKEYDILVFDFDNTLFDYEATEKIALRAVFEALNLAYNNRYHYQFKRINRKIWAESERDRRIDKTTLRIERFRLLFEELNVENAREKAVRASEAYINASEHGVLIEGVENTIRELSRYYSLAIASSGLSSPRLQKLRNSPICDAFRPIMFREHFDENHIKPDRDFFDRIARNYRVSRDRIVFIGDSMREDVIGAKQAGLSTVFFNYFHLQDREIEFDKCDYIIEEFQELEGIFL